MKTLADLKKHAHIYEWALTHNSWYKSVPNFQSAWRSVARVLSNKLALNTIKDGLTIEGWIYFPKASELTISHDSCHYIITINRVIPADPNMGREESIHTMQYHLRPNLESLVA
jgi:hypothetical protein